ncbi:MAG: O-antigen ligase family protein [Oscillospiraceae bacterium]|nr:O-antigen ligase family protein [Oscillospiraceae bacterium]
MNMKRIRSKSEHIRFYSLFFVMTVVLFIRYAFQVEVPRVVFTILIALIALAGTQDEIVAICMCCIPLHESVDFFHAVVICTAAYVLKFHRKIRINLGALLVLTMIFWELLHCFDSTFSIMGFLVSVIPLIVLAVMLCTDVSELDYVFIVRAVAITTAILCVVLLTKLIIQADFNVVIAINGLRRLGLVSDENQRSALIGEAINPNTLGILCVLAITTLMQLRTIGRHATVDVLLMIVLLIFGTLTSSRTYLVCLALMIVLLLMGQRGNRKQRSRFLFSLLILLLLAIVILNRFFPTLMKYYIARFSEDDITTGRMDLMRVYNEYILDNPDVMFFGVGLHNFGIKLTEIYRVANNAPHNGIQEIIIAWGIPGSILFVLLLAMMIRLSKKYSDRHVLLNYIPLLVILTKSMAGQLLTSPYTMLSLSFAYLSLAQVFKLREKT